MLGLRPFSAKAEILPEQVIGRGLRLVRGVGPDGTQTLEVLGTQNLLEVLGDSLEAEGASVATTTPPPMPVTITPLKGRLRYDIAILITRPMLSHNVTKLSAIDPLSLGAAYDQADVMDEPHRLTLRTEFATLGTEVHEVDVLGAGAPPALELLAKVTNDIAQRANLSGHFAELYPLVRTYVQERCFGIRVGLEKEAIRSHLNAYFVQEGIIRFLARELSHLSAEERPLEFETQRSGCPRQGRSSGGATFHRWSASIPCSIS